MSIPHPNPLSGARYSAVELMPSNDTVLMLDQRSLPAEERYLEFRSVEDVARGIADMVVRGAPAIGITAAYGMVIGARSATTLADLERAGEVLEASRPTAVNLAWGVAQMLAEARRHGRPDVELLAEAARRIHAADVAANRKLGRFGAERVPDGAVILTHCNAGALATGGYGSALGVIRAAVEAGKRVRVFADETRPYLQGTRLTAWELAQDGIDVEIIADSSSGSLFRRGAIHLAVVGADRIAKNGDVANKIGTYTVAALARLHERPFYVAAPWSTVDVECASGEHIPIEERSEVELTHLGDRRIAPAGVHAKNPAFDVTPSRLVSAIFTERGVIEAPWEPRIAELADKGA